MCVFVHVCMHVNVFYICVMCMCLHIHVCAYFHVCVCAYVSVYVCIIYMHTHKHLKQVSWNNIYIIQCTHNFLFYFLFFLLFFLERGEGKEKERERNINVWLPFTLPVLVTWPATQACALTGNQTSNPLVHRPMLNPLSYTSQGIYFLFNPILLMKYSGHDCLNDFSHLLLDWNHTVKNIGQRQ